MRYFKSILFILFFSVLNAEEVMPPMNIEYGGHDILQLSEAYQQQDYVDQQYYENVIEMVQGGNQLAKRGEHEEAIKRFLMALGTDSTYVFAHNALGNSYLQLEMLDKAEEHFLKAILYGPNYAFSYNNLANLYLKQNQEDKALSWLRKALKFDPNSAYIHYNIGNIYLSKKKYNLARYYYGKAIDKDPELCNARYNLAITFKRLNQEDQSIEQYEQLIKKCPGHVQGVLNLAAYYIRYNEMEKALMLYKQAIAVKPNVEVYLALGHAYHNLAYNQKEIETYQAAVQSDSTNIDARYYLALAYFEQDMPISATLICDEAIAINIFDQRILDLKEKITKNE